MLRTLSVTYQTDGVAIGQPYVIPLGTNAGLSFSFTSVGGGQWRANRSMFAERMSVNSLAVTVLDSNSRFCLGAGVGIGLLTGDIENPLHVVARGFVGQHGDLWVRARCPFRTDYGLFLYVPPGYATGVWFFRTECSYFQGPGPQRGV